MCNYASVTIEEGKERHFMQEQLGHHNSVDTLSQ
jgi:hypothetical protein